MQCESPFVPLRPHRPFLLRAGQAVLLRTRLDVGRVGPLGVGDEMVAKKDREITTKISFPYRAIVCFRPTRRRVHHSVLWRAFRVRVMKVVGSVPDQVDHSTLNLRLLGGRAAIEQRANLCSPVTGIPSGNLVTASWPKCRSETDGKVGLLQALVTSVECHVGGFAVLRKAASLFLPSISAASFFHTSESLRANS